MFLHPPLSAYATAHLVSPLIDNRHINIIHEDGHPLSSRRAVGAAHAFVYVALYGLLKHAGQRGRREVEALAHMSLRVILTGVALKNYTDVLISSSTL